MADRYVVRYDDDRHLYWIDGERVPSVTTVIEGTTAKDGVPWWAMRVGMAGVVAMMNHVPWAQVANAHTPEQIIRPYALIPDGQGAKAKNARRETSLVEAWVRDHRLTVNDLLEQAGLDGEQLHAAAELLGVGEVVDIDAFPPEKRGKLAALVQWWLDQDPEFVAQEMIVGSKAYGFAGRFDALLRYPSGRLLLKDFKSSGNVYLSYAEQVSGYRIGLEEQFPGEYELDGQGVVWLGEDGTYIDIELEFMPDAFLAALRLHQQRERSLRLHAGRRGIYEIDNPRRFG